MKFKLATKISVTPCHSEMPWLRALYTSAN
uniref:Uncharacterized protein n=1 Tax=Rhizophora mucronata TaxID=61149 RepID=A0A2P2N1K3_RHIMU